MAGANLAFSKVVATPTPTAWSQAYSAGSLFAAISLQSESIPQTEEENLNTLGKEVISTLESEFFTLENKDLESIKLAVTATVSKVRDGLKSSLVVCYLNENILYLYANGGGKAILKRGEKIGTVLDSEESIEIKSASGYVQDKDIIILETAPFLRIIASSTLASSLDKSIPEEIAEELAPHVHEKSEGGASAVILTYKEGASSIEPEVAMAAAAAAGSMAVADKIEEDPEDIEETTEEIQASSPAEEISNIETPEEDVSEIVRPNAPMEQEIDDTTPPETPTATATTQEQASPFLTNQSQSRRKRGLPKFGLGRIGRLSRTRKLILLVGIILIIVLIVVGIMAMNKQSSGGSDFDAIYNEARAKYDEGQSLKDLNASLSQESFKQAQAILIENKDTFPDGSDEDQQIEALLAQVNEALGGDSSSGGSTTSATEVDKSESKILSAQIDNPSSSFFTQNEDFIYFLDTKGVNRIDKGNSEKEAIIDKDWKTEGGIGVFGSNVYVLDRADGILKFVPSGEEFTSSDYFASDAPDLSESAAMAIDGSIYVLNSNGTVDKYTKGKKDDFSVGGLEKPLSSPTRISANEDQSNIYVLDKGNSRIVVLDKEGKFVKAYSADIIKNAKDFDIQETNKKILVLSDGKIFKIDIK